MVCGRIYLLLLHSPSVHGQQDELAPLRLRLRRDLGFGFASMVRGTFTIFVDAPLNVAGVRYQIDGREIGESKEKPFRWRLTTAHDSDGAHIISAEGFTHAVEIVGSNALSRRFVSAVPTFAIAGGLLLLGVAFRAASYLISIRVSNTQPREKFGHLGGTKCPKCGQAYTLHWWSNRLLAVRLDRCPHCGSWRTFCRALDNLLAAADKPAPYLRGRPREMGWILLFQLVIHTMALHPLTRGKIGATSWMNQDMMIEKENS